MKCQCRWIDHRGIPTPDENQAIGLAVLGEAVAFPICEAHATQINTVRAPGWSLVRLPPRVMLVLRTAVVALAAHTKVEVDAIKAWARREGDHVPYEDTDAGQ